MKIKKIKKFSTIKTSTIFCKGVYDCKCKNCYLYFKVCHLLPF